MSNLPFDPTLILIGIYTLALLFLIILTILILMGQSRRRRHQYESSEKSIKIEAEISELKGSIQTLAEMTVSRQSEVSKTLNDRLDTVGHRLQQNLHENSLKTNDSLSKLQERLSIIDLAQQNITELSSQVVSLQDILSNKQSRGAFGQGRMENIIQDALPSNSYTFQATLSNGKRPDCLIHLPNNPCSIVIDAKFPLEGFEALHKANNDAERSEAMKLVRLHITKHLDDISEKYFISGETQDTAIMFIPSERIYADLNTSFPDLIQKAYRSRIIIAAPNMLMLAVQTIQSIMKDVQMREAAGLIKKEVSYLMEDIQRLNERVLNLQRHFGQANKDMEQIIISSEKISSRGQKIDTLDFKQNTSPKENSEKSKQIL